MKYVFTQNAGESRFLARNHCISVQLGYENYLSDNGYSYTVNLFVHDAYYKWRYLTITDLSDKSTKLPYVIGDEIYFILGHDLDKFKKTILKSDVKYFKFVEKDEFYDWVLYNGSPRLKEIADNYLKNTKCSYVQFKDLNVGEVFKFPGYSICSYMKVGLLMDTEHPNYAAVVLAGTRKGHIIEIDPETNVKRCIGNSPLKELANKYLKDDKDSFMTYSEVPYDKLPNDPVNYTMADVRNTLELLSWYQNGREISFPLVEKVIFNNPATIVIWADGTKTVVKCQKNKNGKYEKYDKEKGLALCYMKKALGNKYDYYSVVKNIIEKFG